MKCTNCVRNDDCQILDPDDCPVEEDTITLKRIHSTHCQVCGRPNISDHIFPRSTMAFVYFVPIDNNLVCLNCAECSEYPYEPRIYKEGE